jgi:hypothetical protein
MSPRSANIRPKTLNRLSRPILDPGDRVIANSPPTRSEFHRSFQPKHHHIRVLAGTAGVVDVLNVGPQRHPASCIDAVLATLINSPQFDSQQLIVVPNLNASDFSPKIQQNVFAMKIGRNYFDRYRDLI